jgi:hypothetical protein
VTNGVDRKGGVCDDRKKVTHSKGVVKAVTTPPFYIYIINSIHIYTYIYSYATFGCIASPRDISLDIIGHDTRWCDDRQKVTHSKGVVKAVTTPPFYIYRINSIHIYIYSYATF